MTKKLFNKAEIHKFNRLVEMNSSPHQLTRIQGRLGLSKMAAELGKEKCDAIWAELQARDATKKKKSV